MPFPEADAALERCVVSLRGHDELIVVVNDGIGFGPAVNRGLALARGDIIWVINNDTELVKGTLAHASEYHITIPSIEGQPDDAPRAFYAMPRCVYEEVGGYDERFEIGYFEDDDMIKRWLDAGIGFFRQPSIHVTHLGGGGLTVKRFGEEELMRANRARFVAKWGNAG